MAHTHTLLWSFFVVCWKYLCSFFFWKLSHFRMIFCFLRSFTVFLLPDRCLPCHHCDCNTPYQRKKATRP